VRVVHPGRVRSEAALTQIPATCPIPASSGNTVRHRLNRGGDRRLNWALNPVVLTRTRTDPATRDYVARRTAEGKTGERSDAVSSATPRQIYRTLNAAADPERTLRVLTARRGIPGLMPHPL
jgi:transposase